MNTVTYATATGRKTLTTGHVDYTTAYDTALANGAAKVVELDADGKRRQSWNVWHGPTA